MISRYASADFIELWSDKRRYDTWLRVELAACSAMELAGFVPVGVSDEIKALNIAINPSRIEQIEKTVKHDVIAFLTHVEELVGEKARWLHRGMTSSDVLDTSLAILLRDAMNLLIGKCNNLLDALEKQMNKHAKTLMMGRSHGMFAEPVTFGLVLAGHYAELQRCKTRLEIANFEISFGKISGAVGTYVHLTPSVELAALEELELRRETVSTQIVARDRHAAYFMALALLASAIERFATNIRHWQRSDVSEAEEAFDIGQKGSSAMPHKRNPIQSENLCGLSRVVRSMVVPALENVPLWHERDISHSSVERMIAPDATTTLGFMLERATKLIDGLVVYPDNMRKNVERANELYFSETVLLALVDAGIPRQKAYVYVQRNAMKTLRGDGRFIDNLKSDADVIEKLTPEMIDGCFDVDKTLAFVPQIIDRAVNGDW
jgi:adenylosuccinate lyase